MFKLAIIDIDNNGKARQVYEWEPKKILARMLLRVRENLPKRKVRMKRWNKHEIDVAVQKALDELAKDFKAQTIKLP